MAEHLDFVLASYGLAALIVIALIVWLWVDRNATVRELENLEKMGLRRRSDSTDAGEQS